MEYGDVLRGKFRKYPLHDAVRAGDLEKVRALLKSNAEFDANDRYGGLPLWDAAREGHEGALEKARALIRADAGTNVDDHIGRTPLHVAAICGHKDIAEDCLIANSTYVNAQCDKGRTPLHVAAIYGHKDVAELLLAKGADVNAKTKYGYTPLHSAMELGHKDVAELLHQHGGKHFSTADVWIGLLGTASLSLSCWALVDFVIKKPPEQNYRVPMMIALLALYLVGLVVAWKFRVQHLRFFAAYQRCWPGVLLGLAVAAELVFRPPPAKTPLLLSVSCFLCGPLFLSIVHHAWGGGLIGTPWPSDAFRSLP